MRFRRCAAAAAVALLAVLAASVGTAGAVVVVGDSESEGTDRSSLTLTGGTCTLAGCVPQTSDQNALISAVAAANPNTMVVLDTGGPVLMPWLGQIKGLMEAWYPGQEDGNALGALLFGDVDPSAHLPETFPASETEIPISTAAQWPGITEPGDSVGPHSIYSEGLLVGYRWYQAKGVTPLFPFGFGLSYTTFRFSDLAVTPTSSGAVARFTLQNTGSRYGADVAQAYVGMPRLDGRAAPATEGVPEGVARARTEQDGLDPSARDLVCPLGQRPPATGSSLPGDYTVYVGDSSASLPLQGTLSRSAAQLPAGAY